MIVLLNDFILWLLWYNNMVPFSYAIMYGKPPGKTGYYNKRRDIIFVLNYIFTRRFRTHDGITLNDFILWLQWYNNMVSFSDTIMCRKPPGKPCYYNK